MPKLPAHVVAPPRHRRAAIIEIAAAIVAAGLRYFIAVPTMLLPIARIGPYQAISIAKIRLQKGGRRAEYGNGVLATTLTKPT